MNRLELRIPPLVLLSILAIMMYATAKTRVCALSIPGEQILSIALCGSGLLIAIMGQIAFRKNGTSANPLSPEKASVLVTSGIYSRTRNPMYLGFFLILIGWWLNLDSWLIFPFPLLFFFYINRFQIYPEERMLRKRFGKAFDAYCHSVGRWI